MNIINSYDKLDENLAKILNIDIMKQIKYIEGIIWCEWTIYENNEKIINFINEKINEKIKKYTFIRCKKNNNISLIELDVILDRNIKFLVISFNDKNYEVIMAKTFGMFNDVYNNYEEFNPANRIYYDINNDKYETNENKLHIEIEYNLIYKLLKEK